MVLVEDNLDGVEVGNEAVGVEDHVMRTNLDQQRPELRTVESCFAAVLFRVGFGYLRFLGFYWRVSRFLGGFEVLGVR